MEITKHTQIIQGIQTAYTVCGEGEPLLFLHGWGCNKAIFARLQQELSDTYTVYSLDFPGFGETPPPNEVWGVDAYTSFVEDFIANLGLINPVLLGHSFGGRVSILCGSRNTNLRKIILIDAAGVKPKRSLKYYLKVYSYKMVKNTLLFCFGEKKGQALLEQYRGQSGSSDYSAAQGIMRPILSRVVNEDLKCEMPKIKVPTLLLWGTADTATPIQDAYLMEKLIPDAGLVKFEGASHYSFLDCPVETHIIIKNFLAS